jgi:hypothetical protein
VKIVRTEPSPSRYLDQTLGDCSGEARLALLPLEQTLFVGFVSSDSSWQGRFWLSARTPQGMVELP